MTVTMVVDGNNLLVRAIKAMERTFLQSHGVATGPLLSFINQLGQATSLWKPDRLIVCWDGGRSAYRQGVYSKYKADRSTSHHGSPSFELAKRFLSLSSVHHVEIPNVEGDDIIAALWRDWCRPDNDSREVGDKFVIFSSDKDFFQLLDPGVYQIRPGDETVWDTFVVKERLGAFPVDMPTVMALTGDTIDGVPGVPGYGTKTAVKHLEAHNWSLPELFNSEDPKVRAKIKGHEDIVARNLMLVDLRHDLVNVRALSVPKFAPTTPKSAMFPELLSFLQEYEMHHLIERVLKNTLWYPQVVAV